VFHLKINKEPVKKLEILYGAHKISFSLIYKDRRTIKISVNPDRQVEVTAPRGAPVEKIIEKVRKRAGWILKQKNYFSSFYPGETAGKYLSGETHRYLGRQYRLKILPANKNNVKLIGKYILIHSRHKDDGNYNKKLLYEWYKKKAENTFKRLLDEHFPKVRKYGIQCPLVKVKWMKSRWGSCKYEKNKILFNTQLIKAPSHCVAYVIVHELCHLKYPHHNKEFYNFLDLVMPDWQERKKKLEKVLSSQ
jgi:predicted metal-dependent hydrolase